MVLVHIIDFCTGRGQGEQFFKYPKMPGGKGRINCGCRFQYPAVKYKDFWGYTAQVGQKRISLTGLRPQVNIGYYRHFNLSFFHSLRLWRQK